MCILYWFITARSDTTAFVMCIWGRRVVPQTSQCSRNITAADHSHRCDVIVLHSCLCLSHQRREGGPKCRRQCFIQDHGHTRSWQTQRHTDKRENTIENLAKSEDTADRGADRGADRHRLGWQRRWSCILCAGAGATPDTKTPQNPENTNIRKQNGQCCFNRVRSFHSYSELTTISLEQ